MLSYTPSQWDPKALADLTVGEERTVLLATLSESVEAELGRSTHQHHLLIGPRGSGKTHLLTLLAERLRTVEPFRGKVLLAALPEEEVAPHPADLLIKILYECDAALGDLCPEASDAGKVREARALLASSLERLGHEKDDQGALELAADTLGELSKALGRLVVALVENLDSILFSGPALSRKGVAREQWGLRKALQETSGFLVIASAPTFFSEVQDPRAAFYDFFRHHTLGEMSPDEIFRIMEVRLAQELRDDSLDPEYRRRVEALADGFEDRKPDIQGLLTLTGGLPRFGHLFYDLLVRTRISGVERLLSGFLDTQSPYFQTRLDPRVIPEAELAVLDTLAQAEGPLAPKEIVNRLRAASPNAVNTQLQRLKDRGLVKSLGRRPKVRYELGEPLFRIWRRFRTGRGPRGRLVALAELIAQVYREEELAAEISALSEGPRTDSMRYRLLAMAHEMRLQRISGESMPARPSTGAPAISGLPKEVQQALAKAEEEYSSGSLQEAYTLFESVLPALRGAIEGEPLARVLSRTSHTALLAGRWQEALDLADEALSEAEAHSSDLGRANAIMSRGEVLFRSGRNEDALKEFDTARDLFQKVGDDLGRANALRARGDLRWDEGDTRRAFEDYCEALSLAQRVAAVQSVRKIAGRLLLLYFAAEDLEAEAAKGPDAAVPPEVFELAVGDRAVRGHLTTAAVGGLALRGATPFLDRLEELRPRLPRELEEHLEPFRLAALLELEDPGGDVALAAGELRRAAAEIGRRVREQRVEAEKEE